MNNTDAEGRLTLADALVYACSQGVEKVYFCLVLLGCGSESMGSEKTLP